MTGRELAALSGQDAVVVIRRPFVEWLGSIPAALLLDQLLYEADRHEPGAAFHVTDAEWCTRLLLGRRALEGARELLTKLGHVEATRTGSPARMYYRVDADAVAAAFGAFLADPSRAAVCTNVQTSSHNVTHQSVQNAKLSSLKKVRSKKNPPAAKPPAEPRPADPLWDAFVQAWALPAHGGRHKGLAGEFSRDAGAAGATPAEVAEYAQAMADAGKLGDTLPIHKFTTAFLAWRRHQRAGLSSDGALREAGMAFSALCRQLGLDESRLPARTRADYRALAARMVRDGITAGEMASAVKAMQASGRCAPGLTPTVAMLEAALGAAVTR